jgi:hypothetical protein
MEADDMDLIQESPTQLPHHDISRNDSEHTLVENQNSSMLYDPVLRSIEVSDRSSASLSMTHGLSPEQLHKPSMTRVGLGELVLDDDVGEDIRMLWQSECQPIQARSSMSASIQGDDPLQILTAQEAFLLQLFRNKLGTWVSAALRFYLLLLI